MGEGDDDDELMACGLRDEASMRGQQTGMGVPCFLLSVVSYISQSKHGRFSSRKLYLTYLPHHNVRRQFIPSCPIPPSVFYTQQTHSPPLTPSPPPATTPEHVPQHYKSYPPTTSAAHYYPSSSSPCRSGDDDDVSPSRPPRTPLPRSAGDGCLGTAANCRGKSAVGYRANVGAGCWCCGSGESGGWRCWSGGRDAERRRSCSRLRRRWWGRVCCLCGALACNCRCGGWVSRRGWVVCWVCHRRRVSAFEGSWGVRIGVRSGVRGVWS